MKAMEPDETLQRSKSLHPKSASRYGFLDCVSKQKIP